MFQFFNGLPVRQTIRFGQSRILCSQNTFFVFAKHVFVFAKHVFCVRNSHQNMRKHSKPQTLCAVLFAGEYVKHERKKQSKTETQER